MATDTNVKLLHATKRREYKTCVRRGHRKWSVKLPPRDDHSIIPRELVESSVCLSRSIRLRGVQSVLHLPSEDHLLSIGQPYARHIRQ